MARGQQCSGPPVRSPPSCAGTRRVPRRRWGSGRSGPPTAGFCAPSGCWRSRRRTSTPSPRNAQRTPPIRAGHSPSRSSAGTRCPRSNPSSAPASAKFRTACSSRPPCSETPLTINSHTPECSSPTLPRRSSERRSSRKSPRSPPPPRPTRTTICTSSCRRRTSTGRPNSFSKS